MAFHHCYTGKRVFLTGHTGFKGAWLAEWLLSLGAEVYGYSLNLTNYSLINSDSPAVWLQTPALTSPIYRPCPLQLSRPIPTLSFIWLLSHWSGFLMTYQLQPLRPMSWGPCICWRRSARRSIIRARWFVSLPTNVIKTASGFTLTVRKMPWVVTTPTAPVKVPQNWSFHLIGVPTFMELLQFG
jgi:hypothetical protein